MPVNIALLGSGLFAESAYLPALLANTKDAALHTIWSRSSASAVKLLEAAKSMGLSSGNINVEHGEDGFDKVLADPSVDGVIIVLPISRQPELVLKALKAGKHVISEKPVGKDVKTARETIEVYEKQYAPKGLIWRVAENFAHEPGVRKAREALQTPGLGPVLYWSLRSEGVVIDGSKYQATTWRTIPDYQGGFLLDGGVHQSALIRTALPTLPRSIVGFASLHRTHLLPHDTVTGVALPPSESITDAHGPPTALEVGKSKSAKDVPTDIGKSEAHGQILMTFAAPDVSNEGKTQGGLVVTCLNGTVTLLNKGGQWEVKLTGAEGSDVKSQSWTEKGKGVEVEVGMFARAIAAAKGGQKNAEEDWATPREALWDVALIEALLTSNGKPVDLEKLIAGK